MLSEQSSPDSRRVPAGQSRERGRDTSPWNRVRTLLGLPSSQDGPLTAGALKCRSRATAFDESLSSNQTEDAETFVDVSEEEAQVQESGATRSNCPALQERKPTQRDGDGRGDVGREPGDILSGNSASRAVHAETDTSAPADGPLSQDQRSEGIATTHGEMPTSHDRVVHVTHTAHDVDLQRRPTVAVRHSLGFADGTPGGMLSVRRQDLTADRSHDADVARPLSTSLRFAADGVEREIPERVANDQDLSERLERLRRTVRNLEVSVASQVVRNREGQPDRPDRPSSSLRVVVVAPTDTSSTATRAFWERRRLGHLSLRSGR